METNAYMKTIKKSSVSKILRFKTSCPHGMMGTFHIFLGHGFIGYPKGRNVERALGFSLTGTVSTSPNLAKEGSERVAR